MYVVVACLFYISNCLRIHVLRNAVERTNIRVFFFFSVTVFNVNLEPFGAACWTFRHERETEKKKEKEREKEEDITIILNQYGHICPVTTNSLTRITVMKMSKQSRQCPAHLSGPGRPLSGLSCRDPTGVSKH